MKNLNLKHQQRYNKNATDNRVSWCKDSDCSLKVKVFRKNYGWVNALIDSWFGGIMVHSGARLSRFVNNGRISVLTFVVASCEEGRHILHFRSRKGFYRNAWLFLAP